MTAAVQSCVIDSPVGRLAVTASNAHLLRIIWTTAPLAPPPQGSLLAHAAEQLGDYFARKRRVFDLPLAPVGLGIPMPRLAGNATHTLRRDDQLRRPRRPGR